MIDHEFVRELKIKTDEQIFDAIYFADSLDDEDFKTFMTEAMIRLMGAMFHE